MLKTFIFFASQFSPFNSKQIKKCALNSTVSSSFANYFRCVVFISNGQRHSEFISLQKNNNTDDNDVIL